MWVKLLLNIYAARPLAWVGKSLSKILISVCTTKPTMQEIRKERRKTHNIYTYVQKAGKLNGCRVSHINEEKISD